MNKPWREIESDAETEKATEDFWVRHRSALQSGEFWTDRIKKLRSEPEKRLQLALENLPLPAAFRDAAVATRTLIKEKRKTKQRFEDELAMLYWLAAIFSFSIPYSEVLKEPGYNVVHSIPGKMLKELSFSYQDIGYEKLILLNKTDIKWLVECWGEPESHRTLHDMHQPIWQEYEGKLLSKRQQRQSMWKEFYEAAEG